MRCPVMPPFLFEDDLKVDIEPHFVTHYDDIFRVAFPDGISPPPKAS